jgi:hypothetical protein
MKITTNIEPLKSTTYGKTIEIEFEYVSDKPEYLTAIQEILAPYV